MIEDGRTCIQNDMPLYPNSNKLEAGHDRKAIHPVPHTSEEQAGNGMLSVEFFHKLYR
jgi:hypothetical protein